jgi:aminopeptidase N
MKQVLFLLLFSINTYAQTDSGIDACASAKTLSASRLLQNSRAKIAYPGDDNIDVTYYKLNIALNYGQKDLRGDVTIGLKSKINGLTKIVLDLSDALKTDSVKVLGKKVSFVHTKAQLSITLPQAINTDQWTSVVVYYGGTPATTSGFGTFAFGTINAGKSNAIWSLSEPFGASDWFPCKDNPADKADSSDVWLTAPAYYVSVSNGLLEKVITNNDGTKTYRWKSRYPIANYLISIALSNYTQYNNYFKYTAKDSMLVSHFVQPDGLAAIKINLDQTPAMLKLFTEKFGPYPFLKEKYGHAEFGWGGGMEHQTISSMANYGTSLMVHELGHQWFGDKITCQTWAHIWLNEGFATYAEALWAENTGAKTGYDNFISAQILGAKAATSSIFVRNPTDVNAIFNTNRSYRKSCMVLHILRGIVGETVFFKILQTYAASKSAYGNATTEDFQAVAEAVYGQKLDYFFKQWIYGESYPTYKANWTYNAISGNTFRVTLNLIQKEQATDPKFFTMPVQVRLKTALTDTTVTIFNNQLQQEFNFLIRGLPQTLTIDPDNWILRTVESTTLTTILGITSSTEALRVYPNPSKGEVNIEFDNESKSAISLYINDLLGRKVQTLLNNEMAIGRHRITTELPPGIYFVSLENDSKRIVKKIIVEK